MTKRMMKMKEKGVINHRRKKEERINKENTEDF